MMYNTALIQFFMYLVTLSKNDNFSTHTPNTVTSRKNITTADKLHDERIQNLCLNIQYLYTTVQRVAICFVGPDQGMS